MSAILILILAVTGILLMFRYDARVDYAYISIQTLETEVIYGSLKEDLAEKGVLFTDTDTAVREHPEIVQQYLATVIPSNDNKFAALNSAVESGGSGI